MSRATQGCEAEKVGRVGSEDDWVYVRILAIIRGVGPYSQLVRLDPRGLDGQLFEALADIPS